MPTSTVLPSRQRLQRRVLTVVVCSQVLGGAGLAAGVTVGALLAKDMLGSTALAGLPAALFTGGSAVAALLVGRVSQRFGRRSGLSLGYLIGALGSAGVALAAIIDSVWLLLPALTVYGSGVATNLQARYAAADLAEPRQRGRAVSIVLVATTAGAVAGPSLVGATGDVAAAVGAPPLSGPFALAGLAYGLAAVVLVAFLRPDPLPTARRSEAEAVRDCAVCDLAAQVTSRRTVGVAASAMVLTQAAMVAVMTMTPVHLMAHGHSLDTVGAVIAVHIASMYLPSPLTGWLADAVGRGPVLVGSAVVLVAVGLVAALADPGSVLLLGLALGLLGLGWNLGLVGGTALLTDATSLADRARTQGGVDLAIALAGATASIASGGIVAAAGYPQLALLGGAAGLLVLPVVLAGVRSAGAAEPATGFSAR
ncbi:MFS transporter [soil metagenome]